MDQDGISNLKQNKGTETFNLTPRLDDRWTKKVYPTSQTEGNSNFDLMTSLPKSRTQNQSVRLLNTVTHCLNCKFECADLDTKPKSGRNTNLRHKRTDIKVWNKFSNVRYKLNKGQVNATLKVIVLKEGHLLNIGGLQE